MNGYSAAGMDYFKEFVRNNAHLMLEFSKEGGILNASNFQDRLIYNLLLVK